MRQGGFKPKSHNSGTYWVRANANTGGKKKAKPAKEDLEGDHNGDGVVDEYDIFHDNAKRMGRKVGYVISGFIFIFALYLSIFR